MYFITKQKKENISKGTIAIRCIELEYKYEPCFDASGLPAPPVGCLCGRLLPVVTPPSPGPGL